MVFLLTVFSSLFVDQDHGGRIAHHGEVQPAIFPSEIAGVQTLLSGRGKPLGFVGGDRCGNSGDILIDIG
jgi:hypothetical protein